MRIASILLLLWASAASAAEPKLKLPAEVKGETGAIIVVESDTDCLALRWVPIDSGLSIIPPHLLKDSRSAVVIGAKPGRYRLLAYGAKGDTPTDPAICIVVVGNAGPAPVPNPTPNPNPNPKPPADPLVKAIQAAYDLERGDTKDGHRLHLIEVYKRGVATADNPSITKVVDLFKSLRSHALEGISETQFVEVRKVITDELNKVLPTTITADLDTDTRRKCREVFKRIQVALEAAK